MNYKSHVKRASKTRPVPVYQLLAPRSSAAVGTRPTLRIVARWHAARTLGADVYPEYTMYQSIEIVSIE